MDQTLTIWSDGAEACNKSIWKLIQRIAQRVFSSGNLSPSAEQIAVSLPATASSLKEYFQLERFSDREDYHSRLQTFIRAGAVHADWDWQSSDKGQLARLRLDDPALAAQLLDTELPWVVALKAIERLEYVAKQCDLSIEHIIDSWKHGKAPGGVAANNVQQFLDSVTVIDAARKSGAQRKDLLLRRLSAQLFGDSKRIESLAHPIAYLLGDTDLQDENIFSCLGLVKHPQPMLLSGSALCIAHVGTEKIPLLRPYIGLRPDVIDGLSIRGQIKHLLTIENLASFNEAAEYRDNPDDLILVYVAGNPTPSWLAAYRRLLQSTQPTTVLHWGDIDVGGFRIAGRLAQSAAEEGFTLDLWKMNAASLKSTGLKKELGTKQISQIADICEKYGWLSELDGMKENKIFREQESIEWVPPNN